MTETVEPLTADQALAAADLRAYWRDLDREAEQAVRGRGARPRAWPVHRIVPTPSVPLRLGDVALTATRWDGPADDPTCQMCGRAVPTGTRCGACGGWAAA